MPSALLSINGAFDGGNENERCFCPSMKSKKWPEEKEAF